MKSLRIKLRLYKAFAKHPRLSFWSLTIGAIIYAYSLWCLATLGHGLLTIEFWSGLVLAYTCEELLTRRIKKLFGR